MDFARLDAQTLFALDQRWYSTYGHRFDVAGVPRWSDPASPDFLDANHAAFGPGVGVVADQISRIADAQALDGTRTCIDVYGPIGLADELCLAWGLKEYDWHDSLWHAPPRPHGAASSGDARSAPPVVAMPPEEWTLAIDHTTLMATGGEERARAMALAAARDMAFYGIRVGERWAAAVGRFDDGEFSRLCSLRVDAAFQRTGFARACVERAVLDAGPRTCFFTTPGQATAASAVARQYGAHCLVPNVKRRYLGR